MRYMYVWNSPIGSLYLAEEGGALTHLLFNGEELGADAQHRETDLLRKTITQLEEYFAGRRKEFDLSLAPEGTDFQLRCWAALRQIPLGETRSYKDIAEAIERPKAVRAVGMANNRNPIAVIVPCHRVIGVGGDLVGYGGGLDIKEKLLRLEGVLL